MDLINNRFSVVLKGDEADESLRLSDLIAQLDAIKNVLNQLDKRVSGKKSPGLYYRVSKMTMNSPATIEFEAVSKANEANYGHAVVARLNRDLNDVIENRRPPDADIDLLESYKALVQPLKRHLSQFTLLAGDKPLEIPKSLDSKVEAILGPDQIEMGSIIGSLDVLDVHNEKNLFKIYPVVGPSTVKCHFKNGMLSDAVSGIKSFVRISGELHYKKAEKFPHFVEVYKIEILPEKTDAPLLSSLRGMAKNAYGGLSATEYIDKIRDGDW